MGDRPSLKTVIEKVYVVFYYTKSNVPSRLSRKLTLVSRDSFFGDDYFSETNAYVRVAAIVAPSFAQFVISIATMFVIVSKNPRLARGPIGPVYPALDADSFVLPPRLF